MFHNRLTTGLATAVLVISALFCAVACSNGNGEDIAQKLGGGPTKQTVTPTTPTDGESAWTIQFGTEDDDLAWGVAVDAEGNLYVVGKAGSALPEQESLGGTDAFLRKYDKDGRELWTRQFGTDDFDQVWDIAIGSDGGLYLAGSTGGAFPEHQGQGDLDAFVARYDGDGNQVWVSQFGTSGFDEAFTVGVDSVGAVYVAGTTDGTLPGQQSVGFADAFLRKYDLDGNEIWTRQFGTTDDDSSLALTTDSLGTVYVAGEVGGALPDQTGMGGIDVWLKRYDSQGEVLWTRQFGTRGSDSGLGLGLDAIGGIYLVGSTSGELISQSYAGDTDAFLRKYDGNGNHLRTVQFGTESLEEGSEVVVDVAGNVYVAGFVGGAFSGQTFLGGRNDAYVVKFDASLTQVWTRQFGTPERDLATTIAVGHKGSLYVAGGTEGTLPGQVSSGRADAFVVMVVGNP